MPQLDQAEVNMIPDLRIDDNPDAYSKKLGIHGQRGKSTLCSLKGLEQIKLRLIIGTPGDYTSDRILECLQLHMDSGSSSCLIRIIL